MNAQKMIAWTTAFLVLLLGVGSFVLSYNALRDMAQSNGITGWLSYIWPLLIDASLIVFSLAVVNSYLQSESIWKQWGLVGIYTLATIGFNVAHAPANVQAQIVAAIAPVSLFFSFELLMSQLRTSVQRQGITQDIKQLSEKYQMISQDLENLTQERDTLQVQIDELKGIKRAEMAPNDTSLSQANDAKQAQISLRREQVLVLTEQGMSQPEIANELGVSIATVKRDTKALNGRMS